MTGYETSRWGGILAPTETPKAVVTKLKLEINKALNSPDVRQRLQDAGIQRQTRVNTIEKRLEACTIGLIKHQQSKNTGN